MAIKIDNSYDIYKIIKVIKSSDLEDEVIVFSKDSKIYLNASNLLIIKKIVENYGKRITFEAENPKHTDYIQTINEDRVEFLNPEIDIDHEFGKSKIPVDMGKFNLFSGILSFFQKKKSSETLPINEESEIKHNVISYSENGIRRFLKPVAILFTVLVIIFGLFYFAMYVVPSAEVNITLKTDALVKILEMKAVKDGKVDVENRTIPALEIATSESDTQTVKTTGIKIDGEKSSGKITLTNKTDKDIKVKKNTVVKLISSKDENLKYVLKDDVTVPKRTETTETTEEGTETTTVFGTKEAEIQAIDFGEKYNQDKDQKFEIEDYDTDELVGENDDEKLSGGKLEEKKVVSQEDLDKLKKTVEDSLKEKVADSLKKKIISSQELIESTITYETSSANYSKKLDEESEDLTLVITMQGKGIAYSEEDLDSIVRETAKTVVPDEFNLDGENIDFEVAATVDAKTPETINLQVKLRSYIFPKVDMEKIRQDLAGKSFVDAENYINNIQNMSKFEIKVVPQLPASLMRMPLKPENIRVKIEK